MQQWSRNHQSSEPEPEQVSGSVRMDLVTDRLRYARLRAGINQRFGAAEKFGWDYATYVAHERGQVSLSLQSAKLYAKAFQVSVEWLLYGKGEIDRRERSSHELTIEQLREEVERLTRENAALLVLVRDAARALT